MWTENKWEHLQSEGMKVKERWGGRRGEVKRGKKGLKCKKAHTQTLTEKQKNTHRRPRVCGGLGVNVICSSLWSESFCFKMPAVASQITLDSSPAFPPHHATVEGQRQPFLISTVTPRGENPDGPYSHVWKLIYRSTWRQTLTLKKHRHRLIDFCLQPVLVSSQNLSNNIPHNPQLTANHIPAWAWVKHAVRLAQYATQHSSVYRILANVNLAGVVYTAWGSCSCVKEQRHCWQGYLGSSSDYFTVTHQAAVTAPSRHRQTIT